MRRSFFLAAMGILVATSLGAQAPEHLQLRIDRSTSASDPDDVPDVTVTHANDVLRVNTGPAAVVYDPENTASGSYTLKGRFTLLEPSDHVNYYGLVFGGRSLEGSSQNYLYFLVAQNGSYIIKHRANDETTHDIVARTESDAVNGYEGEPSVNDLEVRVGESTVDFVVNGTVVHSAEKGGMLGRTDGIYGVRINHRLPGIVVEGLEVES